VPDYWRSIIAAYWNRYLSTQALRVLQPKLEEAAKYIRRRILDLLLQGTKTFASTRIRQVGFMKLYVSMMIKCDQTRRVALAT
jgi:hypothetical protein